MRIAAWLDRLDHPLAPEIKALHAEVQEHAVFSALRTSADVATFMEHHVWAVWDFMSLLKSLQAELAPARVPWRPSGDAYAAHFVNSIVLGEESDVGPDGAPASHFEIYLGAMRALGADRHAIDDFVEALRAGVPVEAALAAAPAGAARFVRSTLASLDSTLSARVSSFTVGREDIIPSMFGTLVAELANTPTGGDVGPLRWYLERHVTVDGDEHGPMAWRLFERVCLASGEAREQAICGARAALAARKALWDAIVTAITGRRVLVAEHRDQPVRQPTR